MLSEGNLPMIAGCLKVATENVAQGRLALDALFLLQDLVHLAADWASKVSDVVVDNGGHCFFIDVLLFAAMCHQHADIVAELSADGCVALKLVYLEAFHAQLLALDLVVLRQIQVLDAGLAGLLASHVVAVDERLYSLLETLHEPVLLHGLDDHVRRELELVVVNEDDSVLGVYLLQPFEKVEECCDFSLCLDDLKGDKSKMALNILTLVMFARGTHLVRLHRFKHAEAADVDHANLMALASTRVQVHERHDVLRVLGIRAISGNVHNLKKKK